jgi:hypothetical protein
MLVIDHADQRPLFRHVRQQAQHGQSDDKPVRRRTHAEAERGPQRITLRNRQMLGAVQHRRQQLVQPGERQLHLRLHTHRARHPAPLCAPGQVVQQCGLAHSRLAVQYQHPAFARPDRFDEPVE